MYASLADLKARLGVGYQNLYAKDSDGEEDLAESGAEIDGCIAKRYAVPVSAVSAAQLLKGWQLTLCEERAYARGSSPKLADSVQRRVDQVRNYLRQVMVGEFQLVGAEENHAAIGSIAVFDNDEPEFTRDKLAGY